MRSIIFICTGNSARSQMAEGFMRHLAGDRYNVYSAGLEPSEVNPFAAEVMREIGIDISAQYSKHIREFLDMDFDYVITVCDSAKERCPHFSGRVKNRFHWSFPDPAAYNGSREEKMNFFRKVRDMIKDKINAFLKQAE